MSKSNTWETGLLNLVFNNVAFAGLGDAGGLLPSAAGGSLYLSLHTADPGEAGDQTTNECAYTGYARLAVVRTSGGWTISGNQASNAALAAFAQCTGGSSTAFFCGIGTASSGAGKLLYSIPLGVASAGKACNGKASNDTITIPGNTLVVDDRVAFFSTPSATLPVGITESAILWVKTSSGNDITVAATQGGTTIDITADGAGIVCKMQGLAIANLITPQFATGQLVAIED